MFKTVLPYLEHIAQECTYLKNKSKEIEDFNAFINNEDLKRAFVQSIGIIGEAVSKIDEIDPDYKRLHPEIPWPLMKGMRNQLIHKYFEINYDIVWNVVKVDTPEIYHLINLLIEKEKI